MIFLTVGTQLPFNRLVRALDQIAPTLGEEIVAQTGSGHYRPLHFATLTTLSAADYDRMAQDCRLIVAHAGIGSLLAARRFGKPLIVMPRRAHLGEHRSNHQMATVAGLSGIAGIHIAHDAGELRALLLGRHLQPSPRPEAAPCSLSCNLAQYLRDLPPRGEALRQIAH